MTKKLKPLTLQEKQWIAELQGVLRKCPSDRFVAFTIGDQDVTIYDKAFSSEIMTMTTDGLDVGIAVDRLGCTLARVQFPFPVESSAG